MAWLERGRSQWNRALAGMQPTGFRTVAGDRSNMGEAFLRQISAAATSVLAALDCGRAVQAAAVTAEPIDPYRTMAMAAKTPAAPSAASAAGRSGAKCMDGA